MEEKGTFVAGQLAAWHAVTTASSGSPEEASSRLAQSRIGQIHVTKSEEYQGPD
jgi:hypothetical protein